VGSETDANTSVRFYSSGRGRALSLPPPGTRIHCRRLCSHRLRSILEADIHGTCEFQVQLPPSGSSSDVDFFETPTPLHFSVFPNGTISLATGKCEWSSFLFCGLVVVRAVVVVSVGCTS
jgi:hypothetical protein